jgi:chitodextrinase
MAVDFTKLLKRVNGIIVPQYWNDGLQDWEVLEGSGGAYRMQVPVEVSDEPFGGTGNLTKEFTSEMTGLVISNDSEPGATGAASLTFTIDGKTRTVKAGEVYEGRFKPFTVVTVNSTVPWRAEGLQTIGGVSITVPTPDTTPPDNVTNLITSALTATGVTLSWTASASNDCVGYDIYRGPTFLATVTGTTYNASGLTQATQYTFTVKAKDAADNIATGTATTITTSSSADTTPPADVTNLTTANITQTGLTLNWTASVSSDVASYDVYNGSTFLANVTGITYNVNGLSASTAFTLWVKAKDISGNSATGTSVSATTSAPAADTTAPSNVTGLSTSSLTQTGVTLTWSAATDNVAVTGYEIYNGATFVTTVTALTYNVTGLTASTQYTLTVKARDAAGNVASGTSTTFTTSAAADTTAPNPVTGLSAGTPTANSVPLSWTLSSSGDVTTQEVSKSTDGTNFSVVSAVVNAASNTYEVTGLSASTAYTFRVITVDAANNRSTATTTTATTAASSQTTYVSDDFNRSDSGSLGTSTTGQTWLNGSLQIISNQVGTTTLLTGNAAWNVIDSTHADNIEISLDATFPAAGWSSLATGIVFRFASGSAMYCFGAKSDTSIGVYMAGGSTVPANVTVLSMAGTTKTFKVKIVGQNVECYMDGVLKMAFTDALLTANAKHGIGLYNTTTGPKFDNFSVKSV